MHVLSHEHQETKELFCLTFNVDKREFWKVKCDYLFVPFYSLHNAFPAHAAVLDCQREKLSDFTPAILYLRECNVGLRGANTSEKEITKDFFLFLCFLLSDTFKKNIRQYIHFLPVPVTSLRVLQKFWQFRKGGEVLHVKTNLQKNFPTYVLGFYTYPERYHLPLGWKK